MEKEITLQTLSEKLDSISRMTLIGAKSVLDLEETILFTGMSKGHLYRLTSAKEIPHFKKNRKLYFKKSDLERWLLDTPCLSNKEVNSQAATYVSTHRKRI
ncbi:MAG: helix-turn-helix domain-containing protein [Bacteroidales bacterium]|nr:helix-turn-helix domain-containing protein [Bacteroidales bacterium]